MHWFLCWAICFCLTERSEVTVRYEGPSAGWIVADTNLSWTLILWFRVHLQLCHPLLITCKMIYTVCTGFMRSCPLVLVLFVSGSQCSLEDSECTATHYYAGGYSVGFWSIQGQNPRKRPVVVTAARPHNYVFTAQSFGEPPHGILVAIIISGPYITWKRDIFMPGGGV